MVLRCARTFLSDKLESVQRRALSVIYPSLWLRGRRYFGPNYVQASQCGGVSYAWKKNKSYTILVTKITFYYLLPDVTLTTTTSGQGRPVVPRHVTTGTCAVRSVLAHLILLPSIKRTVCKCSK